MMSFIGISQKEKALSTSKDDPLNVEVLPDLICQQILSFLDVSDLLTASLVSKLWYQTIGSSLAFEKKIAIRLHAWNRDEPLGINNSSRRYSILSISDFKKIHSRTMHALRDKEWKKVSLSIGKVSSQKSFIEMIDPFATVRELRVMSTNIRELNRDHKKLILPCLESLVLSDVTLDLFDVFIANQPCLKSLSLRFVTCDILSPRRVGEAITEFLQLNGQVRDLEMNHVVTNDLFLVDSANGLGVKLRSITLGLSETSMEARWNIEKFLRSQGESLAHLKLILNQKFIKKGPNEWGYWQRNQGDNDDDSPSQDVFVLLNSWNSLTTLESLCVRFINPSADYELQRELIMSLKQNTNVTSLFVQFMNVRAPASISLDLMKLLPNLKTLYITKLTPSIVRYAAIHLKVLRNLMCFSFEGECQQEYNELKTTRSDVNKFIVISERCHYG